jgi:hypothetical protein
MCVLRLTLLMGKMLFQSELGDFLLLFGSQI